jgi:WhiB family redox-sensing transcriptional regulator
VRASASAGPAPGTFRRVSAAVVVETSAGIDVLDAASFVAELRPRWHDRAACRGRNTRDYFPPRGMMPNPSQESRALCASCPVRLECLADALAQHESRDHGIYGGTSERQRKGARKRGLTAAQTLAAIDAGVKL